MTQRYLLAFILGLSCLVAVCPSGSAQSSSSSFKVTTDLVSSYIWRGIIADQSPNIQPAIAWQKGGFEAGAWGSYNFTGTYKEVDLYAMYTYAHFSACITDYSWSPFIDKVQYFDYGKNTTGHLFEGQLIYKGPEKFPLSVMVATMFYGADRKIDKITGADTAYTNKHSTYAEVGYSFRAGNTPLNLFAGLTFDEGLYGNSAGVVYAGICANRKVRLSQDFELPVKCTLAANPQAEKIYLIFGLTL